MTEDEVLKRKNIIAAVRTDEDFEAAVCSDVSIIFDLSPDINSIDKRISLSHAAKKKIFIHLDLAAGIGKDKSGIQYVKNIGVDGIISTRVNIIKNAREAGVFTVQRFFTVDSQSVDTTIEALKVSKADMIEIMPGTLSKIIKKLHERVDTPIIAGGLIENEEEIESAVQSGAAAVSTGKRILWNYRV